MVIEDDGDFSCREWKVIGVHYNIRDASIQAWQHVVDDAIKHDFIKEWWYKTDKRHIQERAEFRVQEKAFTCSQCKNHAHMCCMINMINTSQKAPWLRACPLCRFDITSKV